MNKVKLIENIVLENENPYQNQLLVYITGSHEKYRKFSTCLRVRNLGIADHRNDSKKGFSSITSQSPSLSHLTLLLLHSDDHCLMLGSKMVTTELSPENSRKSHFRKR